MFWHKYIAPSTIIDWFRSLIRQVSRVSVISKVVLKLMEVIRQGLAWKLGNRGYFRIGLHPYLGSENGHILPWNLWEILA